MLFEIEIPTRKEFELIDITSMINEKVKEAKVKEGIAVIFTRHTTTALFINENESGLVADVKEFFEKLVPKGEGYHHDRIDNNAHSHLRSIILNPSIAIPIKDGRLLLGTWQSVIFAELDGPRRRKIFVKICKC
ncbi:secondary thiamine-phosphate synthase enzyme YjbQ [Thermococcus argininiproducens]|uniref:Secondary thiamine-phosphate synthase enzyme YjbQ n=1 Tax=Thermococcus argininiproducens TaxID=2866384 RepID=A0A9E7MAJ7_9EURY|nr:secondary thiamine-phosphate synthase enzyme YjbQ [Thermococcus argininiproducens]USH00079.1 secondary thiamine-phosphate synthase enzyme YjbQ [Thermococcus argininiproducens]